jgi:uncharacterized repeat protein (TIGR03803 family)
MLILSTASLADAAAPAIQVVTSFSTATGGFPTGRLVADGTGNLYGTTTGGGTNNGGTIYRLNAANNYAATALASFPASSYAYAGLAIDPAGVLYGTTNRGGTDAAGTFYRADPANNYAINTLGSFTYSTDGGFPYYAMYRDGAGNLYGTTSRGGPVSGPTGRGTIYKLDAANDYQLSVINDLATSASAFPQSGVIADAAGNFYGVCGGGINTAGSVYKLDKANNYALTNLHAFDGATDGRQPIGNLVADGAGNLFGVTTDIGTAAGHGTAFKLDASNNYALTTIATFPSFPGTPSEGMIMDGAGNLYGVTDGGTSSDPGSVFKLDASNNYALSTLATFVNGTGLPRHPQAPLFATSDGRLFGTTVNGGANNLGTFFEVTNSGFVPVVPEPSAAAVTLLAAAATTAALRRRHR